ncbi:hypothetical protein [Nocardioides aequoreus]|uniref:hypothetical protein n=1 Tax=Nocardioides aequoreus TaxID=397278 RepID=UPI0012F6EA02|nr:hypothetical protein [Nocardioides aequoreus]
MAATPPGRPPLRSPRRRRQRSVRVSVALSLLGSATVLVLLSLPTRSPLWLSLASVTSMVLSWAALRMMWSEVAQSRRESAADRAAAAVAYRDLFATRAAEHAEFTTAMTERLAQATLSQRYLEGQVARQCARAEAAEAELTQAREQARRDEVGGRRDPDVVDLTEWDAEGRPSGSRALRQA